MYRHLSTSLTRGVARLTGFSPHKRPNATPNSAIVLILSRGMAKIIECVPNFSEGRNKEVIDAISAAIRSTPGVSLLDVDPGSSTNRTVYTFVGSPDDVVQGALNAAKTAAQHIDMTTHKGKNKCLAFFENNEHNISCVSN